MQCKLQPLDIEVVLVCDPIESDDLDINALSSSGDRPDPISLKLIIEGLNEAVTHVSHFRTLQTFTDNLKNHTSCVVFPYWFGELSRNRHALVPAICEGYHLPYIGADAYTKIVCNDKHLSKLLCKEAGLETPRGFIITSEDELELLRSCQYPIVIKPNLQGSSLGISEHNLATNYTAAYSAVTTLAMHFDWPVLCEEFISGREVSICLIGDHQTEPDIRAIAWAINGNEAFLDHRLFTYELKYLIDLEFSPVDYNHILTNSLRICCNKLFQMLDKVEVMRIDGRVTEKGFVAFELTPDIDLRPDGELAISFHNRFDSYGGLLQHLIVNTLKRFGS